MTGRAVLAQVKIECVVLGLHTQLFNPVLQDVKVVLTLAAADDLADAGNQTVHSGHGLAVGIQLHVERLDLLGVIRDENGLLEDLLREEALVLGLQVAAPVDGVLKLVVVLFQQGDGVGVGDAAKFVVQDVVQPVKQSLVNEFVEEVHFLGSVLQNVGDDILDHGLGQLHIILQVSKGDFRLDHPEFGGMAGGVGVFSPEGGAEGINVAEGHGEGLTVELAGNGQVGGLAEEVLGVIDLAVLGLGDVVQVKGGDLEHFARALAVGAGNQGRVDIHKVPILEELVDGHGGEAADAEHRLEGVGAGTQMVDGAQELHGVALGLEGIVAGGRAFHRDLLGLNLKGLFGVRGENQRAANDQGGADVDFGNFLKIFQGVVIHHLHGGEISTVVQDDKAKLLAAPAVSHPAADVHFGAGIFFGVFEQVTDGNQIHNGCPLSLLISSKLP